MRNIEEIFDLTLNLVKNCGEELKTALISEKKESSIKSDGTIVTKYDLLVDRILSDKLSQIGGCAILSEEHKEEIGDTYFVIDPIDGTHNFNIKWEVFGIMVAFVEKGETIFSIIHLPLLNKTCTAIKGKGTFINGRKVTVKKSSNRLVGSCPITLNNMNSISKVLNNKEINIELRSLACIAAEQTCVISGLFDFAFSENTGSIWDFVGPELMIKEAGGIMKLKRLDNGKYNVIYGSKKAVEIIENIIKIV